MAVRPKLLGPLYNLKRAAPTGNYTFFFEHGKIALKNLTYSPRFGTSGCSCVASEQHRYRQGITHGRDGSGFQGPADTRLNSFNVNETANATPVRRRARHEVRQATTRPPFVVSSIPWVGIEPTRAFPPRGFQVLSVCHSATSAGLR
jgi:hypothetical protein